MSTTNHELLLQVPETINELFEAVKRPNPICIAGYGSESTHKGYLSWILNSDRNPAAIAMARALLACASEEWRERYLGSAMNPIEIVSVRTTTEERVGSRRIDMKVHFGTEHHAPPKYYIGLELKTDAGASSSDQFGAMSESLNDDSRCLGAVVLTLGVSSVLDANREFNGFHAVDFESLYDLWRPMLNAATSNDSEESNTSGSFSVPDFVESWLDSLALEIARKRLAHQVWLASYQRQLSDTRSLGYRLERQPIMYLYPRIRAELQMLRQEWRWYPQNSQNNAVLGCEFKEGEALSPIRDLDGVGWYYEFNDDRLHLKIEGEAADSPAVVRWIQATRETARYITPTPTLQLEASQVRRGRWMTVCRWSVDWGDIGKACWRIAELTLELEERILGTPS